MVAIDLKKPPIAVTPNEAAGNPRDYPEQPKNFNSTPIFAASAADCFHSSAKFHGIYIVNPHH